MELQEMPKQTLSDPLASGIIPVPPVETHLHTKRTKVLVLFLPDDVHCSSLAV